MKTRRFLWLIAGGALTCAASDSVRPDEIPATWIDPTDPSVATIRQVGERQIDRVGQQMIYEIEHAITDKGLALAFEIAHLKDLTLPKPVPGQPRITAVKRTSLNIRNPDNRPDGADRAALEMINNALLEGDPPPRVLVQRLELPGAPIEWRVYRPITTMAVCLNCHGPVDQLKPEIRARIALKYPEDQATGYKGRQWRGLIRVSLADPEPAAAVKK